MSPERPRVVLDTSVIISRFLCPQSVPGQAVERAKTQATLLVSEETIAELLAVLSRPKFAKYVDPGDASAIAQAIAGIAEIVSVTATVAACRDPDDDKFLALAISGRARVIVTGDDDLLALHPFHGIAIVTPKQFVSESLSSIVSVAQPRHHT
jgi:putative PIN family toxin of toxin-antitoxin system